MGNKLAKLLSGSSDSKLLQELFAKADKDGSNDIDEGELQTFVVAALDVMAKNKSVQTEMIPSCQGSGISLGDWTRAHPSIRRDVAAEVATALLHVLDTDKNRTISLEEWSVFDWSSLLESVSREIQAAKNRRMEPKPTPVSAAAGPPKIVISPRVIKEVDFSRMAVGRLTTADLLKRFDIMGEKDQVEKLNISGHSFQGELPSTTFAPFVNLKHLIAVDAELKTLPDLPRTLEILDVSKNRLRSLPSSIGSLKSLKTLIADNNLLRELPVEMGQLKSLSHCNLKFNGELSDSISKETTSLASTQAIVKAIGEGAAQLDEDLLEGSDDDGGLRDSMPDRNMRHVSSAKEAEEIQTMNVLGMMLGQEEIAKISPALARK